MTQFELVCLILLVIIIGIFIKVAVQWRKEKQNKDFESHLEEHSKYLDEHFIAIRDPLERIRQMQHKALFIPKTCNTCSDTMPRTMFKKDKSYIGGYRPICKECYNKLERERYLKRKETKV